MRDEEIRGVEAIRDASPDGIAETHVLRFSCCEQQLV
jgi:hypothetical protein